MPFNVPLFGRSTKRKKDGSLRVDDEEGDDADAMSAVSAPGVTEAGAASPGGEVLRSSSGTLQNKKKKKRFSLSFGRSKDRLSVDAPAEKEAQQEGELSFPKGAEFTNVVRVSDSWWEGDYEGRRGRISATYAKIYSSASSIAESDRTSLGAQSMDPLHQDGASSDDISRDAGDEDAGGAKRLRRLSTSSSGERRASMSSTGSSRERRHSLSTSGHADSHGASSGADADAAASFSEGSDHGSDADFGGDVSLPGLDDAPPFGTPAKEPEPMPAREMRALERAAKVDVAARAVTSPGDSGDDRTRTPAETAKDAPSTSTGERRSSRQLSFEADFDRRALDLTDEEADASKAPAATTSERMKVLRKSVSEGRALVKKDGGMSTSASSAPVVAAGRSPSQPHIAASSSPAPTSPARDGTPAPETMSPGRERLNDIIRKYDRAVSESDASPRAQAVPSPGRRQSTASLASMSSPLRQSIPAVHVDSPTPPPPATTEDGAAETGTDADVAKIAAEAHVEAVPSPERDDAPLARHDSESESPQQQRRGDGMQNPAPVPPGLRRGSSVASEMMYSSDDNDSPTGRDTPGRRMSMRDTAESSDTGEGSPPRRRQGKTGKRSLTGDEDEGAGDGGPMDIGEVSQQKSPRRREVWLQKFLGEAEKNLTFHPTIGHLAQSLQRAEPIAERFESLETQRKERLERLVQEHTVRREVLEKTECTFSPQTTDYLVTKARIDVQENYVAVMRRREDLVARLRAERDHELGREETHRPELATYSNFLMRGQREEPAHERLYYSAVQQREKLKRISAEAQMALAMADRDFIIKGRAYPRRRSLDSTRGLAYTEELYRGAAEVQRKKEELIRREMEEIAATHNSARASAQSDAIVTFAIERDLGEAIERAGGNVRGLLAREQLRDVLVQLGVFSGPRCSDRGRREEEERVLETVWKALLETQARDDERHHGGLVSYADHNWVRVGVFVRFFLGVLAIGRRRQAKKNRQEPQATNSLPGTRDTSVAEVPPYALPPELQPQVTAQGQTQAAEGSSMPAPADGVEGRALGPLTEEERRNRAAQKVLANFILTTKSYSDSVFRRSHGRAAASARKAHRPPVYTFHPEISERSALIDSNRRLREVRGPMSADAVLLAAASRNERLYRKQRDIQQLREAHTRKLLEEEMSDCTFEPEIGPTSQRVASPDKRRERVAEISRTYCDRHAECHHTDRERLEREEAECTFAPALEDSFIYRQPPEPAPPAKGFDESVKRMELGRKLRAEVDELRDRRGLPKKSFKRGSTAPFHFETDDVLGKYAIHRDDTYRSPRRHGERTTAVPASVRRRTQSAGSAALESLRRAGSATASIAASEGDPVMFFVKVDLGRRVSGRIAVRRGDSAVELAREFVLTNGLKESLVDLLEDLIGQYMEKHLSLEDFGDYDDDFDDMEHAAGDGDDEREADREGDAGAYSPPPLSRGGSRGTGLLHVEMLPGTEGQAIDEDAVPRGALPPHPQSLQNSPSRGSSTNMLARAVNVRVAVTPTMQRQDSRARTISVESAPARATLAEATAAEPSHVNGSSQPPSSATHTAPTPAATSTAATSVSATASPMAAHRASGRPFLSSVSVTGTCVEGCVLVVADPKPAEIAALQGDPSAPGAPAPLSPGRIIRRWVRMQPDGRSVVVGGDAPLHTLTADDVNSRIVVQWKPIDAPPHLPWATSVPTQPVRSASAPVAPDLPAHATTATSSVATAASTSAVVAHAKSSVGGSGTASPSATASGLVVLGKLLTGNRLTLSGYAPTVNPAEIRWYRVDHPDRAKCTLLGEGDSYVLAPSDANHCVRVDCPRVPSSSLSESAGRRDVSSVWTEMVRAAPTVSSV